MSGVSTLISGVVILIYLCLRAWPDAKLSRLLLSSFGPRPKTGEWRSHFLRRVIPFALGWTSVFGVLWLAIPSVMNHFDLAFKSETERLVVLFFIGAGGVYCAWIALRSLLNLLFILAMKRDWCYDIVDPLQ